MTHTKRSFLLVRTERNEAPRSSAPECSRGTTSVLAPTKRVTLSELPGSCIVIPSGSKPIGRNFPGTDLGTNWALSVAKSQTSHLCRFGATCVRWRSTLFVCPSGDRDLVAYGPAPCRIVGASPLSQPSPMLEPTPNCSRCPNRILSCAEENESGHRTIGAKDAA
jgi:hypothetical protein